MDVRYLAPQENPLLSGVFIDVATLDVTPKDTDVSGWSPVVLAHMAKLRITDLDAQDKCAFLDFYNQRKY